MPKTETETQRSTRSFETPQFAIGNTGIPLATEVQQMVSEVPTGTKASVVSTMFKPTMGTPASIIKRKTVLASHRLNLPLCDGFTTVKTMTKLLEDMAFNYQRTHQDAFFEAYPELVLKYNGETGFETTSELRTNYRILCARIAHYWFHFMNASMMLQGALANLLSMSRLNGSELFKEVAYQTRWSKINSNTNYFSRVPGVKGVFDYICQNMKYAIGTTAYGAEIVSFPLFKTDVTGNEGWFSPQLDAIQASVFDSTRIDAVAADLKTTASSSKVEDKAGYMNLMQNMHITLKTSVGAEDMVITTVDGRQKIWNPHLPYYQNGGVMRYQNDDSFVKMKMNKTLEELYLAQTWSNDLTDTLWNNYFYWQKYMIDHFKDMLDPNNDKYVFAASQIGIIEGPRTAQDMLSAIRNNGNLDMVKDLLPRMTYRKDNHVNSATIVKWTPIIHDSDVADEYQTEDNFLYNFSRYDVLNGDITKALKFAKQWPSITPAMFTAAYSEDGPIHGTTDVCPLPFVLNSIPGVGSELVDDSPERFLEQYHDSLNLAIIGKGATYFDAACSRNLDPESTSVATFGVTAESAQAYVKSCNGVSFEEDPSTIRLLHQPLIDNSDPYQCGFGLVISSNNPDPSETERFFLKPENFGLPADGKVPEGVTPLVPVCSIENVLYYDHVSIKAVRDRAGYSFIFLGANIFDHPMLAPAIKGAGSPRLIMDLWPGISQINAHYNEETDLGVALMEEMLTLASSTDIGDNDYNSFERRVPTEVHWSTNKNKVIMQYFDPAYGPVKPILMNDIVSGIIPVANLGNNDGVVNYRSTGSVSPVYANVPMDMSPEASQQKITWDSFDDVGASYVPFVDSFVFRPCKSDRSTGWSMQNTKLGRLAQKTSKESWSTLLDKVNVQFTGIEDTYPFWSHPMVKDAYKIDTQGSISGSTSAMPEEDIMAAPRTERTRTPAKKNDYSRFKAANPNRPTVSGIAKSMYSGSASSGKGKKFRNHSKGNSNGSNKPFGTNLDGVKDDSSLVKSSLDKEISNSLDPMGAKDDKLVDKKKKRDGDSLSISTQM